MSNVPVGQAFLPVLVSGTSGPCTGKNACATRLSERHCSKLAVVGAGGWGTALAIVLARPNRASDERPISLWVHRAALCDELHVTRENSVFLPGFRLPESVRPTSSLAEALDGAEVVLTVVPSHHCRSVYGQMLPHLQPQMRLVSATKGLETGSLLRMSEVIREVAGRRFPPALAVLSGPTFAREVAAGRPAAVVVASEDLELASAIQRDLSGPTFRLYTNTDVAGVEFGGSLKNVIAIGAGVCDGLNLGSNAMAALVTRGLAEITRLACACGARRETLSGLAGVGDLVLTCTGALSRNRSLGVALARGRALADLLRESRTVAEGVNTTTAALELARRHGVEMPITEQMQAMLFGGRPPAAAIRLLMERSLKGE